MARGSRFMAIGQAGDNRSEDGNGEAQPHPGTGRASRRDDDALNPGNEANPDDETSSVFLSDDAGEHRYWSSVGDRLPPTLAVLALLGWTGVFVMAGLPAMRQGGNVAQWAGWIEGWSGPAMLIAVAWLLVRRQSLRQARRAVHAAAQVEAQAARLETRLADVNRELSLAREFIAAQSRDLEALGRIAVDRIGQNAGQLQALIHDNGAQIDAIGTVSAAARENMELLRGQLPVIASSVKDVTNTIGNAGRVAHMQLQELVHGMGRLNEFGSASERQVETVRSRIEETLSVLDARLDQILARIDTAASTRISALEDCAAKLGAETSEREKTALAALEERVNRLGTAIAEARAGFNAQEEASLAALDARLTALREEAESASRSLRDSELQALTDWRAGVERLDTEVREALQTLERIDRQAISAARGRLESFASAASEIERALAEAGERTDAEAGRWLEAQRQRLADLGEASAELERNLAPIETRSRNIAAEVEASHALMLEQVGQMSGALGDSRRSFSEAEAAIASLTDGSVRLLELLQSSVQYSRDQLPKAIATGEERLAELADKANDLRDTVGEAGTQSVELSRHVAATQGALEDVLGRIEALQTGLETRARDHAAVLDGLRERLAAVEAAAGGLAAQARDELAAAIDALSQAAQEAVSGIETQGASGVTRLAERLGRESGAAIERAMRNQAHEVAGQLEAAAAHAAGVSREAAAQFRDQLAKVDELAGHLERRVARVREQAQEQVDNDFARRVAVITESLNSNAIDIARVFDAEIADTAWASYLRGDRGIFTRRTVKLLETSEAKAVAQLYAGDAAFHEHVSRYIHDFEAMLRQLLSTRDGHAISVTLLSSDMGKLYVALAQAIARLRD